MKLDDNGYKFLLNGEGFKLKPYLCTAGIPTIAVGNTYYPSGIKVKMTDKPITEATAWWIFRTIADRFAADVDKLITSNVNQNQFNALVSFAYNVGLDIDEDSIPEGLGDSTLLKKVNANPKDPSIAKEFLKWQNVNGKPSKGIINRRKKESQLYFK
jgi:lysozyme